MNYAGDILCIQVKNFEEQGDEVEIYDWFFSSTENP